MSIDDISRAFAVIVAHWREGDNDFAAYKWAKLKSEIEGTTTLWTDLNGCTPQSIALAALADATGGDDE